MSSVTKDSGEVRPFRSSPESSGDNTPKWFIKLALTGLSVCFVTVVGLAFTVAWWGATISSQVQNLQLVVSQRDVLQGKEIEEVRDAVELLDLKYQNLAKEYAVLQYRVTRQGDAP